MSKIKKGSTVNVHYVGTLDDGEEFDNSRSRGEPLTCEVGSGQLINGFDNALVGMSSGETKKFSLTPEEAYGEVIIEAYQNVPKNRFPDGYTFNVGETVQGQGPDGQFVRAKIETVNENEVILNFNHPMAGKNLNFEVEILSIE